uniref:Tyrosinase copper-binding domain-containing protein n=1 Tax=Parascaris univalens TaxID=6257 RepID=A0A915A9L5_PARUN
MMLQVSILIVVFATTSSAQMMMMPVDCSRAPFGFQELCYQLQQLDRMSRMQWNIHQQQQMIPLNAPPVPGEPWLSPAVPQHSFQPSAYDCMDLQCLCPYFRGRIVNGGVCLLQSGAPLRIAVRKEIRQMTDDERNRYFNAMQTLKRSGEYDAFAAIHRDVAEASGAHSGPGFLPWHREFVKRMEIAVRLLDPSLAIPYWDSVMDNYLPDPRDSIIWSPMLFGENDQFGNVVNGPFAGFRTLEGRPLITRNLGAEGSLFSERDLNNVYSQGSVENVLSYTAPLQSCPFPVNFEALEYTHGRVHNWVGGDMKPIPRSANDPVFFSHHSFVDFIFEQWRQMRQNRWQREQLYPPDLEACENPQHFANSVMRPFFNFVNRNGLSNAYTDNMYTFAARPMCGPRDASCGSNFLFCDFHHGPPHCVSKIKMNGLCRGFEGLNACFGGVCLNGFCRPGIFQAAMPTMPSVPIQLPTKHNETRALSKSGIAPKHNGNHSRSSAFVNTLSGLVLQTAPPAHQLKSIPAMSGCFNDDPCCSLWAAKGECPKNKRFMNKFCKRSCGVCKSNMPNRKGCFDRHISCPYFHSRGDCTRKRQWMAENCQFSCGWCNVSPQKLCARVARMSRM